MDHITVSHQRWHDHRLFLSHFRKSPRTVGAIAPSSQRLARAMLDGLALDAGTRVVELGPGTGAITREIADRLPGGASCLAIDIDPVFTARVSSRWPQIDAICDRAEHLLDIARQRNLLPVDHIISGLPFASLPADATRAIVEAIAAALRPGGTFTTFQYVHAYALPPAIAVRSTLSERMDSRPAFRVVLANLPPALVIRWIKAPVTARPPAAADVATQRDSA